MDQNADIHSPAKGSAAVQATIPRDNIISALKYVLRLKQKKYARLGVEEQLAAERPGPTMDLYRKKIVESMSEMIGTSDIDRDLEGLMTLNTTFENSIVKRLRDKLQMEIEKDVVELEKMVVKAIEAEEIPISAEEVLEMEMTAAQIFEKWESMELDVELRKKQDALKAKNQMENERKK
ncbi:hypothetical protein SBOR_4419 [Sclerotinia borealis F-4128]|uniref:Uncharacterized protein n=1 Tax=Sclerotinia borealis (strain F-4128) TaxID=1432307 RepID=W9CGW0_SCLBF|nr:hypothetical protein SBOR_4419 [Sclerotinia borealis F-4128]